MTAPMTKIAAERNQRALLELAIKPGNGEHRFYEVTSLLHEPVPTSPLDHPGCVVMPGKYTDDGVYMVGR